MDANSVCYSLFLCPVWLAPLVLSYSLSKLHLPIRLLIHSVHLIELIGQPGVTAPG